MRNRGLLTKCHIALFVFLFSSFSTAQNTLTEGSMNGRGWKILGKNKVVFLMGFEDGMFSGLIIGKPNATYEEVKKLYLEQVVEKFSHDEVIAEIDRFYEETSNVLIPVKAAVGWVTQKMNGATPAELEKRVAKLRQIYNK